MEIVKKLETNYTMRMSKELVTNIFLVANLEVMGPHYVSGSNESFFPPAAQPLFASRVVIMTGMANMITPERTLQGPMAIAENEEGEHYFYIYQIRPGTSRNLHLIMGVIFPENKRDIYHSNEILVKQTMDRIAEELDFSAFNDGVFDFATTPRFEELMRKHHQGLEASLRELRPEQSLFDVSYLMTMSNSSRELGKLLISNVEGIPEEDLSKYTDEVVDFLQRGLVVKETKEGKTVIRAR